MQKMKFSVLLLFSAFACSSAAEWKCLFGVRYSSPVIGSSSSVKNYRKCQSECMELEGCSAITFTKKFGCTFHAGHSSTSRGHGSNVCYNKGRESEILEAAPVDEVAPEAPTSASQLIDNAIAKVTANPDFPSEARKHLESVNPSSTLDEKVAALENALRFSSKMEAEDALELTTALLAAKNEQAGNKSDDDGVPWWAVLLPCLVIAVLVVAAAAFVMKDRNKRETFHSGTALDQGDLTPFGHDDVSNPLEISDGAAAVVIPPSAPVAPVAKALPAEPYRMPPVFYPSSPTPAASRGLSSPSYSRGASSPSRLSSSPPGLPIKDSIMGRASGLPDNGNGAPSRMRPLPSDTHTPPRRMGPKRFMPPVSPYQGYAHTDYEAPRRSPKPNSLSHIEI